VKASSLKVTAREKNKKMNHMMNTLGLAVMGVMLAGNAHAQELKGRIDGTVLTNEGQTVRIDGPGMLEVVAVGPNRLTYRAMVDDATGGSYSIKDMRPGVYEISVQRSANSYGKFRPKVIYGVIVKSGIMTKLNIAVEPGEKLQEVARPVSAELEIITAQELAKMMRRMEALETQVAALKARQ
jgi:hypothetical protein